MGRAPTPDSAAARWRRLVGALETIPAPVMPVPDGRRFLGESYFQAFMGDRSGRQGLAILPRMHGDGCRLRDGQVPRVLDTTRSHALQPGDVRSGRPSLDPVSLASHKVRPRMTSSVQLDSALQFTQLTPPCILLGFARVGILVILQPESEPIDVALIHTQPMLGLMFDVLLLGIHDHLTRSPHAVSPYSLTNLRRSTRLNPAQPGSTRLNPIFRNSGFRFVNVGSSPVRRSIKAISGGVVAFSRIHAARL
jgi:hypothetical protein